MKEFDNYTEVCVVGEGAFGKVFKAIDKNNRTVAIKHIKFEHEE
jgi:serine/threonine protein kinase